MSNRTIIVVLTLTAITFMSACSKKQPVSKPAISMELVKEIQGLSVPEGFAIDPATGDMYLSNIVTSDAGFWVDDSAGFISKLDSTGSVTQLKWLDSTQTQPIHAPKGMTILNGNLYFTDNTQLKRVPLTGDKKVEVINLPVSKNLNDLANDGQSIWVTDTDPGKAYKVNPDGTFKEIPAPANINGITVFNGNVFAVSWNLHEIYQLDPNGEKQPEPFGLAEHFTALDTIEVLPNGTFIVSDFQGNKVAAILPDRKTVIKLADVESAADIAIDRDKKLLFVPMLLKDKARVYKLDY